MQQLILDGYNVIHKIPELAAHLDKSLEAARRALANFIVTWKRASGYKGKVCVVFDGRGESGSIDESLCGVRCIYTKTKNDADNRIISMVRNSHDPASITVVSSDNYVANNCKAHRAAVKPVYFLLEAAHSSKNSRSDKEIDPAAAKDINEYLKQKWGIK